MSETHLRHERLELMEDPHRPDSSISDVILGGQDGLVNVLGVVLGVAAATGEMRVVLAGGVAAALAESVSMAAVAYTSTLADASHFQSEREREYRHIRRAPDLEREEIRELYRRKGFSGELLDKVVDTITANPDVWVAVMMSEEHRLAEVDSHHGRRAALVVGLASLVGSLLPLLPYLLLPVLPASVASVGVAAASLFALGAYKAKVTVGHPVKSGAELAVIGTVSALVGYGVGLLFRVPGAVG